MFLGPQDKIFVQLQASHTHQFSVIKVKAWYSMQEAKIRSPPPIVNNKQEPAYCIIGEDLNNSKTGIEN